MKDTEHIYDYESKFKIFLSGFRRGRPRRFATPAREEKTTEMQPPVTISSIQKKKKSVLVAINFNERRILSKVKDEMVELPILMGFPPHHKKREGHMSSY